MIEELMKTFICNATCREKKNEELGDVNHLKCLYEHY